ncbi:MAG TPA: TonB-dependent receptor, partial [Saprospiraceae bacterium]|nr:TonB-dependent receptor [Saprospiraceae bacterium]
MLKSHLHYTPGNTRFFLSLLFSFSLVMLFAQHTAIVTGKVIDKASGEPLIGAIIQLDSSANGASTDINGQYRITGSPGYHVLLVRYFGYEPAHIQVDLMAGKAENVDYAMSEASALSLQEVVVVANAERTSNVVLNIELKKAPYIASAITATEIRRIPDRTVGDVLKRVTGASIQDGKFVIIRGMNDRYNAGYLDGSLLSSTESDRKAFAFDVIPASLIDNLIIVKNGSPDLTGDFGGGIIRINTKAVPDKLVQSISVGAQWHSLTTNKTFTEFKQYKGENFNFISDQRDIPDFEEGALRLKSNFPTPEDKARLAGISKQFNNDWSVRNDNAMPNARLAYSIGFPVTFKGKGKMGVMMALNYANTRRQSENLINTFDGSGQVAGFLDRAFLHNLTTGGIFNVNYINRNTQVNFHNLVNINSDFNTIARTGTGNFSDALTVQNFARVLNTNRLYNGIISYKQVIRDSVLTIDASLSYSNIRREIPDYRIASYTKTPDFPDYRLALGDFFNNSTGRFNSKVDENLYTGTLELSKKIGNKAFNTEIKAGYFEQRRDRSFEARSFVYQGAPDETTVDPSTDLGASNIDATRLYLIEKTSDDLSYYQGKSDTRAFYALANQSFGRKFKALYGLRVEDFDLSVHNQKTNQAISSLKETAYLPSANLTLTLTEKTNLRFGYFSSVNRPEFRELAPFSFYTFDKNAEIRGEHDLKIAHLNNMDIRYEFYPDGG